MNVQVIAPQYGGIVMPSTATKSSKEDVVKLADLAKSDKSYEFRATQKDPEAVLRIRLGAAKLNVDMSVFAREAIAAAYERVMRGESINGEVTEDDLQGAPLLDIATACGPITEAREQSTRSFHVSPDVSDEMGFDADRDFFQRAKGFSMQGAGILDEDILCWSPLPKGRNPQPGQVALIAVDDGNGGAYSTAKYWYGEKDNMPQLRDGNNEPFQLPKGIRTATPIAVLKGRIGGPAWGGRD